MWIWSHVARARPSGTWSSAWIYLEYELALAADRAWTMDPGRWFAAPYQRRVHRRRHQLNGIGGSPNRCPELSRRWRACLSGVLAAIAPGIRPLGPRDLRVLTRINGRLRTKPQFEPVELTSFAKTLAQHGMQAVEDARERYRFSIRSAPTPN